jgi:hypothetical protein
MAQTITIKRGLKADLPVLEPLEIGYCTDTREVFIGSSAGNIPVVEALTGAFMVGLINAGADKINDANLSDNVADTINKKHSHSNLAVLNAIEEAFTTVLKNKLDGIASGATKVENSTTNGNIKINDAETNVYTLESHKHVKADITDFPTSMPANGGNADTVGGKNPSDFAPSGYGGEGEELKILSNPDLNSLVTSGNYLVQASTNSPPNIAPTAWAFVSVISSEPSGGSKTRILQYYLFDSENKIYFRQKHRDAWGNWTQIANISDIPTTLPANGGTSSFLGNAVNIDDYDTLNPTLIAQGNITPIKAPSTANSPWPHTSAGFLIQSNDVDSFHMLIFMSGGDGWAYRSYYQGAWSNWKIWSTFSGSYNDLSNKPSIPTKVSQLTNDSNYAPLASPTFTGTPKAPTPATADSSTNIATTAFVKAQGYITAAGSGAKIAVSSSAPTSPQPGDFWYKV